LGIQERNVIATCTSEVGDVETSDIGVDPTNQKKKKTTGTCKNHPTQAGKGRETAKVGGGGQRLDTSKKPVSQFSFSTGGWKKNRPCRSPKGKEPGEMKHKSAMFFPSGKGEMIQNHREPGKKKNAPKGYSAPNLWKGDKELDQGQEGGCFGGVAQRGAKMTPPVDPTKGADYQSSGEVRNKSKKSDLWRPSKESRKWRSSPLEFGKEIYQENHTEHQFKP